MKKIAIFGSGQVGDALAKGFLDRGDAVRRASRDPEKLAAWKASAKGEASIGTYADAAAWADLVVFAVKGTAAESVVEQAGPQHLAGKTVIDATNPIADGPPENGCIRYFTGPNESLMERLQKKAPEARFVKAFNSVGNTFMVSPPFKPIPSMFICGNSDAAKAETTEILTAFGWESVDVGGVELARPIEALCQLWCAPGFLKNDWAHAFKYLRLG
ncbi:MAG: NAD(P)-binding domain-containing protein [Deltaproteobacteria bacterium]|nr:NAD(P)-binding domain-containing protein [Deltaproteobacteria bacterium]